MSSHHVVSSKNLPRMRLAAMLPAVAEGAAIAERTTSGLGMSRTTSGLGMLSHDRASWGGRWGGRRVGWVCVGL